MLAADAGGAGATAGTTGGVDPCAELQVSRARSPQRWCPRARVSAGPRSAGPVAVPEGHAQRPAGRAHEPRCAAGRACAARCANGRDPPAQPAHRHEQHRHGHEGGPAGALPARRGGRAGHRPRPGLRREPLGLRLLLAEAEHAERRRRHGHQRGRRPGDPDHGGGPHAPGAVQRLQRCCRASSSRATGSLLERAGDPRASTCRAASAATSAARSTSTAKATSTCRRATTPTRSSRRATRRSTTARTAIPRSTRGGRPATRTTCAASSCAIRENRAGSAGTLLHPAGQPVPPDQAQTRPEIYVMGMRNPFRFAVNRTNGHVYLGDYSPDAQVADPKRGPEGIGRWMLIRRAANYGWPFSSLRTSRTSTTTSRRTRRSRARSSTASGPSTTRVTTPACASCRR